MGRHWHWTYFSWSDSSAVGMVLSTAVAMFLVGAVAVWSGYELSIQISVLSMKMQEIAMQVSLLNQENERMLNKLSELTGENTRDI